MLRPDAIAPGEMLPDIPDSPYGIALNGRSRTCRRTWLDTFDWRLYRAGLTLELRATRGTSELVLAGRDGEVAATQQASGIRWPCLADALPDGPLQEQLASVIGVRALLPVIRATSVLTDCRALNADQKSVAMLTVDQMSVTFPKSAQPAARLTVAALRGYQPQATKLADALGTAPGIAESMHTPLESALAAVGRKAGDYTGKISVELSDTMPIKLALATILTELFDTIRTNVHGTITDIDTEFLHDLRVAVRRTRSVLKLGRDILPRALTSQYEGEFKWLGDLTTPTRDLDVYLLGYPGMAAQLLAGTPGELQPFHDYLLAQRTVAQRTLNRGLRSARFERLAQEWQRALRELSVAPGGRPVAATVAARQIGKAHLTVLGRGGRITAASPGVALHDLRKRCKELRYLLEVFASLHDPAEQWQAVNQLKSLQDCLGEFQDTEVQLAELRMFAATMMAEHSAPAETLLAMGEIAATLAVRQRKARDEFAGRFADFSSTRGRARIGALARMAE